MKRICLGFISLLFLFQLSAEKIEDERLLDSFDKITATNGINVVLRKTAHEEKAVIKIENGLLSDVVTEVSKGKLKVKMKAQINKELSILVTVYYKELREITATKGASIRTKELVMSTIMDVTAATGGKVKAELQCTTINTSATSGGQVTLYGWTEQLDAYTNTQGTIEAKKLNCDNAEAKSATGGEIWINVKEHLEATVNTNGHVYYSNNPTKVTSKISSGGEVINEEKSK